MQNFKVELATLLLEEIGILSNINVQYQQTCNKVYSHSRQNTKLIYL